ncbi:MAG: polysaccharide biosynthesis/export family protein [Planctomycetes bacterium]|nr:polysaccharide biosynthesis/export family protein [Planctomycetota bacterium]
MKYGYFSGLASLLFIGCAPTHQDVMTFRHAGNTVTSGTSYRVGPTDSINIIAPHAPEVNDSVTVRADGTIHLKLLDEVRVAGLTTREIAGKLRHELRAYYLDPTVHVSLARTASRVFYLFGEVMGGLKGGGGGGGGRAVVSRPITGRDTIMNVLTQSAPTPNAWLSQIKLIRPAADPKDNQEIVINFFRMVALGDMRQNYMLQEGDILYVPPTPMAWIGYRIREILQPIAPVIQAYQAPAQIISADDVYDNVGGGDGTRRRALGGLTLP